MGVISSLQETDAPDGTTAEPTPDRETAAERTDDPFLQQYDTADWKVDTETVNQLLTGLVAVTNLL